MDHISCSCPDCAERARQPKTEFEQMKAQQEKILERDKAEQIRAAMSRAVAIYRLYDACKRVAAESEITCNSDCQPNCIFCACRIAVEKADLLKLEQGK